MKIKLAILSVILTLGTSFGAAVGVKISDYPRVTALGNNDLFITSYYSGSAYTTNKSITYTNFVSQLLGIISVRVRDVRNYGGLDNGINNDSTAFQAAASALLNGETLKLGTNTLLRTTGTNPVVTLTGLKDISIIGTIVNDELGMTGSNWKTISSLVSTGTVAYATTTSAHGFSAGTVVNVYCSDISEYKGAITILSAGLDATHFGYNTLGGTPSGAGTGTMQVCAVDYQRPIIRLIGCSNVNVDLRYIGQYVDRSIRHRLGYVVVQADDGGVGNDNYGGTFNFNLYGAAYGLWAGYYQAPRLGHLINPIIRVSANNVGYGIASWGALNHSTVNINASDVHRAFYSAGLRNSFATITVKNFDVAGWLGSSHWTGGTNHYGDENNHIIVSDSGSTETTSYFNSSARYLALFNVEASAGVATFRKNKIEVSLNVNTVGTNIVAAGISHQGQTNAIWEDIIFSGSIDRSQISDVTGMGPSYEFFGRTDGITKGIKFQNWSVINSSVTATNGNFKRDIAFSNNNKAVVYENATSDSQMNVTVTGDKSQNRDDAWYILNASPTVWRINDPSTHALMLSAGGNSLFSSTTFDLGSGPAPWRNGYFTNNVQAATITVNDDAYNASSWDGSTNVPTKNAIRDKIESMGGGGGTSVYLNGASINNPNFLDSSTAIWGVSAVTNITVNPTNIANAQISASAAIPVSKLDLSGRTLTAGTGLSGGGNLSADRTFSVTTNTVQQPIWIRAGVTNLGVFGSLTFWPGSNISFTTTNGTGNTNLDLSITGNNIPSGTMVSSGSFAVGDIPAASDTTGTNFVKSKVVLTQPATVATITVLNNKTLTVNKSITLDGTDSTTITLPASTATVLSSASGEINAFTSKATPTISDLIVIEDAASINAKKKTTVGNLPFIPTGSIDYSLIRTNPGVAITNANVQIWMKGSDITGYADGATATGFTATTGGVFTNSASTCKYAATAVNGLPALYLQGAHPLLTQATNGMGSAVNSSITMFAVVKIPDNPGGISLYASASGTPFYAGINGMGLLLNTANTSDSSISTGYKPTPGTNGFSTFVAFFRYDGTNKWLGDGLAWDVEPCTGSMGLNDPLVLGDVFGGGFVLNGWLAELIVYKSALPPEQCVGISKQLHYNYGIQFGGFEYLWCDGDSMTHGYGLNSFTNAWPNLLARKYGNNAFVFNSGIDGDTLTNIYSTRVGTIYRPPGIPSRAIIMAGRNDFVADSAPSAKVYELSWKLGRDLRKDGGFRVYFVSVPPTTGGSGTYDADRLRVNTWMRAGWRQFSDGFVDLSRYSIFDTASTTTAWQGDQVHPSVSGEELIAYEVDRTIFGDSGTSDVLPNSILTGTATYDPPNLTNGSTADTTVTVTGAIVGDVCYASHDKAIAAGWRLESIVTGNDTVNVRFVNGTGGTLDLASGKLTVKVIH